MFLEKKEFTTSLAASHAPIYLHIKKFQKYSNVVMCYNEETRKTEFNENTNKSKTNSLKKQWIYN